jgi:hypothetical protein
MAIGTALMSSVEAKRRLGSADAAERKGKVFRTIHIINDALWNSGSRSLPPSAVAEYHQDSVSSAETRQPVDNLTQSMESLATTVEEDEIVGDAAAQICPAEMDRLFHKSLCYAIVNLMDSAEYPIPSSTLFTLYMQAGCPEDADLDIKQSSYKKVYFAVYCISWINKYTGS